MTEPTEGLAPPLVKALKTATVNIIQKYVSVLPLDQDLNIPVKIARSRSALENGAIVRQGSSGELIRPAENSG